MAKFEIGCMWEGGAWEIAVDYECSAYGGGDPCKHCHGEHEKRHIRHHDGSHYFERVWTCPRVVIAWNEGGHNTTGVCLDCILEGAATLIATPPGVSDEGAAWAMEARG